ncbi:MAG: OsmC family protein [Kosmotoga sp.]|nr:MAG: OsmC family protein [Kosmotoga sp.]
MKLRRVGEMAFHVKTPSGHDVYLDSGEKVGGNDSAARPMELVLVALMGCTSMDVVSILRKMKVTDYEYYMEVESEKKDEHPKVFTKINLIYNFTGKNLPKDKIEKAVQLSQEKYCSVSAMLRETVELTYDINYVEK